MKKLSLLLTPSSFLLTTTLKDINGKTVQTDTLSNQGKPFIIDFFATWGKPCNRELDAISEASTSCGRLTAPTKKYL